MGMSNWVACGERSTNNESATISYWRSVEDIHRWALSPDHREAWNWWNDNYDRLKHVGIMHEIYQVPKSGGWEAIYANYAPTGLAATTKAVTIKGDDGREEKLWVNPIVDARRGVYRTSHGRMGRGDEMGTGRDGVAKEVYGDEAKVLQAV
jgi:hypothetical protein